MSSAVSIVIPAYNGRKQLADHLPAVLRSMRKQDELIIVDDASSDDTLDWLTNRFQLELRTKINKDEVYVGTTPHSQAVTVLKHSENKRFAVAANNGVLLAQNNILCLLNSDVEPDEALLTTATEHFSDASVFAVGCLEYENKQQKNKSGKNILWFERGMFMHGKTPSFEAGETAWVSGGSGFFDKQKWIKLGGFDPSFAPAYWEDVDLSHRARLRGWKILFEPRAVVYHLHETTNREVFSQNKIKEMSWKNANLFVRKHANTVQLLQHYLWLPYWLLKRTA